MRPVNKWSEVKTLEKSPAQTGHIYIAFCMYATLSSPVTALFYCYCYSWKLNLTVFFERLTRFKMIK